MKTIKEVLDVLRSAEKDARVYFDFCGTFPTSVESWRGVYSEPALGWASYSHPEYKTAPKVEEVIGAIERAIDGRTFQGWKGGDYSYRDSDTLHIDNQGEYTNTEISGFDVSEHSVTILTCCEPC